MTALEPNSTPGLLGLLIAGVRAEFRSDALEFASDDAVFGGGSCRVQYAYPLPFHLYQRRHKRYRAGKSGNGRLAGHRRVAF